MNKPNKSDDVDQTAQTAEGWKRFFEEWNRLSTLRRQREQASVKDCLVDHRIGIKKVTHSNPRSKRTLRN